MKKIIVTCMVFCLVMAFAIDNTFAQMSSSKSTGMFGKLAVASNALPAATAETEEIKLFDGYIKTSNEKELFIDVSLECGLTTNTQVISRNLERKISEAYASVEVAVLVDGNMAEPGWVTFARRYQGLIAEFAGDFSNCISVTEDDEGNHTVTVDEECTEPEMLALILDTMSANSFNFLAINVPVGEHHIQVIAKLTHKVEGQEIEFALGKPALMEEYKLTPFTKAYIGKGSVTVEEVRMIK
jgi:hypothetical protein